jgi:hypothetical protein
MSNIQGNHDRSLNRLQSTYSTIMKDSGRRSNLNEQSQYERRHCAKRDSTTLDTTSECP